MRVESKRGIAVLDYTVVLWWRHVHEACGPIAVEDRFLFGRNVDGTSVILDGFGKVARLILLITFCI